MKVTTTALATCLSLHLVHAMVISPTTSPYTPSTLPTAPPTALALPTASVTTTVYSSTSTTTVSAPAHPPPEAQITGTPDPDHQEEVAEADERFRQTTYWSCVQWPGATTAHCGWHEPIVDASMPNAAGRGEGAIGGEGLVMAVLVAGIAVIGGVVL